MQQTFPNLQSIYHNYKLLPLILSFAVLIDYFFTFYFAPDLSTIMKYEYSPTLLFALKNNVLVPYIVAMFVFYYIAGYLVLKNLKKSSLYPVGIIILAIISTTHIMGGLSWYILDPLYSTIVLIFSKISIIIALGSFGYVVVTKLN